MTTKEFIEKVNELGYLIDDSYVYWQIRNEENLLVAIVHKNTLSRISTDFVGWWNMNIEDEVRNKLFDLIVEYANTPIEDREEKKYLLLHKFVLSKKLYSVNLAYNRYKRAYRLINLKSNNDIYKVLFTEKEVEKLKEKLDTNFDDFKMVEVEDESN